MEELDHFLSQTLPEWLKKAVEQSGAIPRIEENIAVRVVQDNGLEHVFLFSKGTISVSDHVPLDAIVRLAVGGNGEDLNALWQELNLARRVQEEEWLQGITKLLKSDTQNLSDASQALLTATLRFHLVVTGVPDRNKVVVRVGWNDRDPPPQPTFIATVRFDDFVEAWEENTPFEQVFSSGKFRLSGDYGRALVLISQMFT